MDKSSGATILFIYALVIVVIVLLIPSSKAEYASSVSESSFSGNVNLWTPNFHSVRTADGGFQNVNDAGVIQKFGPDGTLEWSHDTGISGYKIVCPAKDGGLFIITSVYGDGSPGHVFYTNLVKTDGSGNVEWQHSYNSLWRTYGCYAIDTNDGGFMFMAGTSSPAAQIDDHSVSEEGRLYLVKLDGSGDTQWEKTYSLSPEIYDVWKQGDYWYYIFQTTDNGYVAVGTHQVNGEYYLITAKISSDGSSAVRNVDKSIQPDFSPICTAGLGGGCLVMRTSDDGNRATNTLLAEVGDDGNVQWSTTINGSGISNPIAADGGYYVLLDNVADSKTTYVLAFLNANGVLQWMNSIPNNGYYYLYIINAQDGHYSLLGVGYHVDHFHQGHPGDISYAQETYQAKSTAGNITVTFVRQDGADGEVTVNYSTVDGSAIAGLDYVPSNGTITFGNNETIQLINVTLLNRGGINGTISFSLALYNATGGATIGTTNATTIIINPVKATPTPVPTPASVITTLIGGFSFSGGNNSILFQYPSIEKILSTLFALFIGVFLAWFWPWLVKLLQFLYDAIKSYLQKQFSTKEAKYRGVTASSRRPWLLGISLTELFAGIAGILLIGITFAYAKDYLFSADKLLVILVAAGITIVISEMARRYTARHYKADTEYKFWGLGAVTLIITSLLHQPFSRPARTIVNRPGELGVRKQGIIAMAPCLISLVLSIVFLMILAYGNGYEMLGREGFKMGMMLCVYSLLPFEPMDGKRVINWSKAAWAIVFLPALAFYLGMLLFVFP